jgi:hypothetical protein
VTRKSGGIIHADTFGTDLQMRSATPPPVADYDEWLRSGNNTLHGNSRCTGAKLRRIVIMRRDGCTWRECGEAVGVSATTAWKWVEFLPMRMGV